MSLIHSIWNKRHTILVCGGVAALFAGLMFVRVHHVSQSFWLLEDQERDWSWALVDFSHVRLTGTPSHVGGNTLRPAWYWVLWVSRHVLGPWTSNLPHTGAIALALVQSGADVLLLIALVRRIRSIWLAVAIALFAATAPWDLALTAAMWSPEFSAALAKVTIALVLLAGDQPSTRAAAAVVCFAWLTFQAHSSGFFVAASAMLALFAIELRHAGRQAAVRRAMLMLGLVTVLQIPYVIDLLKSPPEAVGPTVVLDSLAGTLRHPTSIHFGAIFAAAADASINTLLAPWPTHEAPWILVLCFLATCLAYRKSPLLLSVTVAPLAAFIFVFALQQTPFDSYYVLPLLPGVAVALGLALTAVRAVARPAAIVCCLIVLGIQPARAREAWTLFRFNGYGALVRGSLEIRHRMADIQSIEPTFQLPPTTDPTYIYWILGGRETPTSPYTARIDDRGFVTFTRVSRNQIRRAC